MLAMIRLLRPEQWYKNLTVFLAIIFSGEAFLPGAAEKSLTSFAIVSLLSGVNYALNDVFDAEKDALHPEKKRRPLASGEIRKHHAVLFAIGVLVAALAASFSLNLFFAAAASSFFLFGLLYTTTLKHIYIVDVIAIGINFSLRAALGVLAIGAMMSPWLFLCTFLIALLLALGKRKSEAAFLGSEAAKHRKVLSSYAQSATDPIIVVTLSSLIISYSIYSILVRHTSSMILTIPIAMFLAFKYSSFVFSNNSIARSPETVFADRSMLAGMTLWLAIILYSLYLPQIF